ncbi:ABC transporter [Thecamonas trahens ATCC 50062]|uniref:ABC transporter n=1 Tax=Thecamonas trahens ATCC 50062 TaxID=461836 RepID=A0A0L0DVW3_THETB|nr:ABC transporter [Thecamonas trahens ATCC 50062]KNC56459.1 ABC transporter [Thecamonas trahens ATCC 50062]|eukprot:XP_013760969.1 ABC transporter [Thecamonas trahens ATCC 50062]
MSVNAAEATTPLLQDVGATGGEEVSQPSLVARLWDDAAAVLVPAADDEGFYSKFYQDDREESIFRPGPKDIPRSELQRFWRDSEHALGGSHVLADVESSDGAAARAALGRVFWRRFKRLLSWSFRTRCCCTRDGSLLALGIMLAIFGAISNTMFFVLFPPIISAVKDRSLSRFLTSMLPIVIVAATATLLQATAIYVGQRVAVRLRKSLTRRLHFRYLSRNIYYRMVLMDGRVDNPDQRIVTDTESFTSAVPAILCGTLDQTGGALGTLVPGIILGFLTLQELGWQALALAILMSICSTFLAKTFIGRVVPLVFRQDRLEGDLRFAHVHIREHAEAIAFLDGHEQQHRSINLGLRRVLANAYALAKKRFPLNLAVNLSQGISNNIAILVPAIVFFAYGFPSKNADGSPNTPSQNASLFDNAFAYLSGFTGATMTLLSYSQTITRLAGVTNRLGEMLEVMDDVQAQERIHTFHLAGSHEAVMIGDTLTEPNRIALADVSAYTPDNVKLATRISFEVRPGGSLLIMGPSGVGKSSLLRVLGGLWPTHGEGTISRPARIGRDGLFYLPQVPYMVLGGSLADQVAYPLSDGASVPLATLDALLAEFDLAHLPTIEAAARDAGEPLKWDVVLSGGEKQRLAMVRLFFHAPKLAILDECTSAVNEELEDVFYQKLTASGIGFVSVAHSVRVLPFHQQVLFLEGPDSYALLSREDAVARLEADRAGNLVAEPLPVSLSVLAPGSATRGTLHRSFDSLSIADDPEVTLLTSIGARGSRSDNALPTDVPTYRPISEATAVGDASSPPPTPFAKTDIPDHEFEAFFPFPKSVAASLLATVEAVDQASTRSALGLRLLERMRRLNAIVFLSPTSQPRKLLLCGSALVLYAAAATVAGPLILARIVDSVSKSQSGTFITWMSVLAFLTVSTSITTAFQYYYAALLGIVGHKGLSRHLHFRYLNGNNYYQANVADSRIDNCDQRLTEDARSYAHVLAQVLLGTPLSPSALAVFPVTIGLTVVAWFQITWIGVVLAYALAILVFLLSRAATAPLVPLVFRQDRLTGDLRFAHVRLREAAESVAFLAGHATEHKLLNKALALVLHNLVKLVKKLWFLSVYVIFSAYLGVLGGFALPGILAFTGHLTGNVENKFLIVYITFNTLYRNIVEVLTLSGALAKLFGHANRLGDLLEIFDLYDHEARAMSAIVANPDAVVFDNVTVETPSGKRLARDLSFRVGTGDSLFVEGPSGVGKSSILRTLMGLWPPASGRVERPLAIGRGGIFFLPQSPLLILGSLKDQIVYPRSAAEAPLSDADLHELLSLVRLSHLLDRAYASTNSGLYANWANILSGGEKQRLAMARLLFHAPKFAILDECTSALDEDMENTFYSLANSLGIQCISVSHRSNVRRFHTTALQLAPDGSWALHNVTRGSELAAPASLPSWRAE